ncbi:CoA transferase [Peptoniphilus equinus]|uniref:CoA transferase n=1 Tax=Peptoniphilus equinus TaxID=3016343 RepID=A0ABY7QRI9_9FIRM|nr:CoA transferase [Peptoniphilus equinus]WBW49389.1 CoA transferase [Peptoniphilus equinus]
MSKGLLDGIVVLDLTRVLAGPYCAALMADMGATVYKIEQPGKGDDSRQMGPFQNGESAYFINCNRGKLGCTLNLKSAEGKQLFFEMVKKADVLLESFRPGTMEKLGLSYDTLKEVNPGLIYGSISGFGHTGPYSKRAGYDIIGQAMGGLMSTTGWEDTPPTRTGTPMGDVLGGLSLAIGVLAALNNKQRTGEGEKVDVSLVDSVVSAMMNINMIYFTEGRIPRRIGNRYESTYPYDSFKAKDGDAIIGAGNDKLFALLCKEMGKEELVLDERFNTVTKRVANHKAIKELVEAWSVNYTVNELSDILNKAGIPASPINTIDRVAADPHIAGARNMFPVLEHPVAGKVKITNNQLKFTNKKADPSASSPLLGEHNEEIFCSFLGHTKEEFETFIEIGAI